ncbi:hypothetical protein [Shimazuella alba]|uniref:Uncharacterized protein n=1 Tax=Shimazuella alba TaxID=2690964 RepID=A0A6I4VVF5_9BACL|nr:hypothetical protein [Shimazuella alba]MXQ54568.1 hypothetical protein [Shimazuella alba]
MNDRAALETLRGMRNPFSGFYREGEGMPKILVDLYRLLENGDTPTSKQLGSTRSELKKLSASATSSFKSIEKKLDGMNERPGDNSSNDPQVRKLVKEYWRYYWANEKFKELINHLG